MPSPRPTLCVINYNGERYLASTLSAAMACRESFGEVILVDNASDDLSLEIVRERFPEVRVLRLPENRGPGVARNAGFRAAASCRVLFIDNDVELDSGCAEVLEEALAREPGAVLAMPRVLHAKDRGTVQYDGAAAHATGLMVLEHAELPDASVGTRVRDIDSLVTACFLADRDRWPAGDLFDEAFFFHFEDHELGLRARLMGCRILSVPAARCFHGEGTVGLSRRETGRHTPARVLHTIQNRWQLILKLYQLRTILLLAPSLLLFEAFQLLGAAKKGWLREWWRALRGILGRPRDIARRRRSFQSLRRFHDADVLSGGPIPFAPTLHRGGLETVGRRILDGVVAANWALATLILPRKGKGPDAVAWRRTRGDLILSFASQLGYKLLGLLLLALLARGLAREEFGAFSYAAALAGVLVLFTELGSSTYLLREAAIDPAGAGKRLADVLHARLPLLGIYALLLNGYALLFRPDLALVLLLTSAYVGLKDVYLSFAALLLGLRRVRATVLVFGSGLVLLAAAVGVVTTAGGALDAVLCCYLGWGLYLVAAGAVAVRLATGGIRPRSTAAALDTVRASLPLFALAALGPMHLGLGTLLVGSLGTFADVATYEVGAKVFEASQFLVRPLTMVFLPICAGLAAAGSRSRLALLLTRMLLAGSVLGSALAVVLIAGADWLVPLAFGPGYEDSTSFVRRISLGIPALYASALSILFLSSVRRERRAILPLLAGVAANALLNAVLIPVQGPSGAAWAAVISHGLLAVWLARLAVGALGDEAEAVVSIDAVAAPGLKAAGSGGARLE
jgi:O-antigen/teichoic acid export membrane protein/GT2 family glycosyltransferase